MRTQEEVLTHFINWANNNKTVRAAIMTSSRVSKNAKKDFLSDYDIELYVNQINDFSQNDDWLEEFGPIMVRWPYKPKSSSKEGWITRLILFKDGVRIDFQITDQMSIDPNQYDNGYKILIDKDGITRNINSPTFSEFIVKKPTKEEYEKLVHEFWWDAYYIPKYLWRDELPFAKYMLDYTLRYSFIHKIVDWYIGYENNWSVETGALGKKYKKLLSKEIWDEFEQTYAAGGVEENWSAFMRTTQFFRKIAKYVGDKLGYKYPDDIDKEVMEFCKKIRLTKK